jgi:hypothetical protein
MKRTLAAAAVGALATTGALLATALPAGADSPPNPAADATDHCPTGQLPQIVKGDNPNFKAGAVGGYYVWHDGTGWHLTVTHEGHGKQVFAGVVKSSRKIDYTVVRNEKNDWTKLSSNGKTLHFRFVNTGYIDGVDFHASCARLVGFNLHHKAKDNRNHEITPARVFLGSTGENPTSTPFVIERRQPLS